MIITSPNPTLADQEIDIIVRNLHPGQHVTLRCFTIERRVLYTSHAHFVASLDGQIDTKEDGSFGGTYTGISQMGLFWSMQPVDDKGEFLAKRYIPKYVSKPSEFVLQVFVGHLTTKEVLEKGSSDVIYETTVLRSWMGPGVTRHVVQHGRLSGTIFKPNGKGPFKGVVDTFGGNGGIVESRAALLASHGFVAYALSYLSTDSDERKSKPLEIEYFIEAFVYFQSLDFVQPGVSAIGLSFGGTIMLLLSTLPECGIKSLVTIGSKHYIPRIYWKGKVFPSEEFNTFDFNKRMIQHEYGAWQADMSIYDEEKSKPFTTPLETSPESTKYLFIVGGDDKNSSALEGYTILRNRMIEHGREKQISALIYPNAGHFIDPPYMPQTIYGFYFRFFDLTLASGGEMIANAAACKHAWDQILKFLGKNTGTCSKL